MADIQRGRTLIALKSKRALEHVIGLLCLKAFSGWILLSQHTHTTAIAGFCGWLSGSEREVITGAVCGLRDRRFVFFKGTRLVSFTVNEVSSLNKLSRLIASRSSTAGDRFTTADGYSPGRARAGSAVEFNLTRLSRIAGCFSSLPSKFLPRGRERERGVRRLDGEDEFMCFCQERIPQARSSWPAWGASLSQVTRGACQSRGLQKQHVSRPK